MQLQQLTYFVEIAERGSFNKAAEALFVTQHNLSKAISNLEAELNTEIFLRTNKGVALTLPVRPHHPQPDRTYQPYGPQGAAQAALHRLLPHPHHGPASKPVLPGPQA